MDTQSIVRRLRELCSSRSSAVRTFASVDDYGCQPAQSLFTVTKRDVDLLALGNVGD
jgi:hypothetical protein